MRADDMANASAFIRDGDTILPREEGTARGALFAFVRALSQRRLFRLRMRPNDKLNTFEFIKGCETILPLPGGEGRGEGERITVVLPKLLSAEQTKPMARQGCREKQS